MRNPLDNAAIVNAHHRHPLAAAQGGDNVRK